MGTSKPPTRRATKRSGENRSPKSAKGGDVPESPREQRERYAEELMRAVDRLQPAGPRRPGWQPPMVLIADLARVVGLNPATVSQQLEAALGHPGPWMEEELRDACASLPDGKLKLSLLEDRRDELEELCAMPVNLSILRELDPHGGEIVLRDRIEKIEVVREIERLKKPPISAAVAAQRYLVTKKTIRTAVADRRLTDHRAPGLADNAPLRLDEAEVARLWPARTK